MSELSVEYDISYLTNSSSYTSDGSGSSLTGSGDSSLSDLADLDVGLVQLAENSSKSLESISGPIALGLHDYPYYYAFPTPPLFSPYLPPPTPTERIPPEKVYWALALLILPVLAVIGNILVILAVYTEKSLHSVTNYFIVSLALADLLVAGVVMPFAVYVSVNVDWELSQTLCDFYIAVDVTCSTASIFNLVAISIDRFIAVTQPIKYSKHKNNGRVAFTIAMVWLISAAIGSPIVFGLNTSPDRLPNLCVFYNSDFIIYSSLSSFYIPCVLMVFLYYKIFKALRDRAKAKAESTRKLPVAPSAGTAAAAAPAKTATSTPVPTELPQQPSNNVATPGTGTSVTPPPAVVVAPESSGSGSASTSGGPIGPPSTCIVHPPPSSHPTQNNVHKKTEVFPIQISDSQTIENTKTQLNDAKGEKVPTSYTKAISGLEVKVDVEHYADETAESDGAEEDDDEDESHDSNDESDHDLEGRKPRQEFECQVIRNLGAKDVEDSPPITVSKQSKRTTQSNVTATTTCQQEGLQKRNHLYVISSPSPECEISTGPTTTGPATTTTDSGYDRREDEQLHDHQDNDGGLTEETAFYENPHAQASPALTTAAAAFKKESKDGSSDTQRPPPKKSGILARIRHRENEKNASKSNKSNTNEQLQQQRAESAMGSTRPTSAASVTGGTGQDQETQEADSIQHDEYYDEDEEDSGKSAAGGQHGHGGGVAQRPSLVASGGVAVGASAVLAVSTNAKSSSHKNGDQSQGDSSTKEGKSSKKKPDTSKQQKDQQKQQQEEANGKTKKTRFNLGRKHKSSRKKREKASAKRERKATKTLAIVLGVFLFCWVPFFTCNILDAICIKLDSKCGPGVTIFLLTTWLGYMNSVVNPIIYTVFNPEFRKAFKRLLSQPFS